MIVFEIHCNFFIALPIQLKTCRSNGFFLLGKICAPKKSGKPEVLCAYPGLLPSPLTSMNNTTIFTRTS